jgi:hypothetical protein
MKILPIIAAAAIAVVAMPIGTASAAQVRVVIGGHHHHGWHRVCEWRGHGRWRHQVCHRARW